MLNSGKHVFALIANLLLLAFVVNFCLRLGRSQGYEEGINFNANLFKFEDNIFKTVAHIDLSSKSDVQLIYSDAEKDVAYYMYTGEREWISAGDIVYFCDGSESVIVSTDVYGFIVEDVPSVTFGFSGSAVINSRGEQLGYVSERLENGYIYCIWI